MRRLLVLFLTLFVLWAIVAQLNQALSSFAGMRVYLFTGSLYVTFAALTQPARPGLLSVILGGVVCDANSPVHVFGEHTLLFMAAYFVLHQLRDRVPREENTGKIVAALLTNLALFLAFSFIQVTRSPMPGAVWPRLLADLFCSQVFLVVVTPWFFALQARSLVLAGVDREVLV